MPWIRSISGIMFLEIIARILRDFHKLCVWKRKIPFVSQLKCQYEGTLKSTLTLLKSLRNFAWSFFENKKKKFPYLFHPILIKFDGNTRLKLHFPYHISIINLFEKFPTRNFLISLHFLQRIEKCLQSVKRTLKGVDETFSGPYIYITLCDEKKQRDAAIFTQE